MGALTDNRKREADFFPSNQKPQSSLSSRFDFNHVSKKSKTSPSLSTTADRPKSFGSRISLYPDVVPEIKREIQAPTRVIQGFTSCFRRSSGFSVSRAREEERSAGKMGNFLGLHYRSTKNAAIDSLRYFRSEKGHQGDADIDADGDVRIVEASPSDKVDNVTDGSTGDEGLEHGSGETQMILEKYKELEGKDAALENPSSSEISDLTNGKMLESLSIDTSVPPHKKLLDSTRTKYDDRLKRLSFEINLQEKRRACQQLLHPAKKEEEEGVKEPFLPLTEDDKNLIATAFSNSSRRKSLVSHENSGIEITGEVLRCLLPRAWLNDEVINLYLELLKERERREPKKFLKCHFFNTFFYKKLIGGRSGYDYKSVKRWTTQRKLGYSLLECDKIFVPVHKEVHWCLAVINKRDQKFQYLDSLGGMDKQVMGVLAKYFMDEVKDKSGKDIDVTSWKQEYVQDLPNQENGFDCGVFMIKYADFYSRDIGLCFSQEHMPYFRLRTAKEILRLKAD